MSLSPRPIKVRFASRLFARLALSSKNNPHTVRKDFVGQLTVPLELEFFFFLTLSELDLLSKLDHIFYGHKALEITIQ